MAVFKWTVSIAFTALGRSPSIFHSIRSSLISISGLSEMLFQENSNATNTIYLHQSHWCTYKNMHSLIFVPRTHYFRCGLRGSVVHRFSVHSTAIYYYIIFCHINFIWTIFKLNILNSNCPVWNERLCWTCNMSCGKRTYKIVKYGNHFVIELLPSFVCVCIVQGNQAIDDHQLISRFPVIKQIYLIIFFNST